MSLVPNPPRYIFFGSPQFAAIVLEKLIAAGFVPAVVVCNPDRPVGRKKIITAPPVKRLIANSKLQIEILQPENLKTISDTLHAISPDFAVVAAYAKIIPKNIIELPKAGVIGVHPSLLPKHRGASPIQSVILSGDTETGVTLFLIDEKVDHGPILTSEKLKVKSEKLTYTDLQKKLAELAGNLLIETLPKFLAGNMTPEPQNESEATYTKKFETENAYITPDDLARAASGEDPRAAEAIDRKIRALNPEPGAWTTKGGKRIKLLEAEITCAKLQLKKIQPEGKVPTLP